MSDQLFPAGNVGVAVHPRELNFLVANLHSFRVVVEQFLVLGAENEVPLLRVEVTGDEVFVAKRVEGGVEFGGRGFMENRDALKALVCSIFCHCSCSIYLSSGPARWRMRVWK